VIRLPKRRQTNSKRKDQKRFPGHCAWVRGHRCSVPGCEEGPIECAHVRSGSNGGMGVKPSDFYSISLCRSHHEEQHRIGEEAFERRYGLVLLQLAEAFSARSPHRDKWQFLRN
jgi:hypothetical protein